VHSVVVADAADHLVIASEQGVYEVPRGSGERGATISASTPDAIAVRQVDGGRVIAMHVGDDVQIVSRDGSVRTVALPPGRADVRGLVIDAAGRVVAVREAVVDTLERDASAFVRTVLVGRTHAWSATPAADGDREGGMFVVGEEGERGVVVRVTANGQQTFATTDTRIWRAWASKSALWAIDSKDTLYRIDLATRAVRVEHPEVGPLGAISGAETAKGDLVVVVGDVSAVFDGERFQYPTGSTAGASSVAVDLASGKAYVAGDRPLRAITIADPWARDRAQPFEASIANGPEHGPLREPERKPNTGTLPSLRFAYGYGRQGDRDSAEFDAAFGLRLGAPMSDDAGFFVWPEGGYTATGRGHYAMLGAGVHYGSIYVSTGPWVRGLLGAEEEGSEAAGIRSSWQVTFLAGLFNVELGHQLMFVPGGPRNEGRAVASVDLLAAGGLALWLGVPLSVVSGVLITEALR
jgi:hypothetical protein